jgi:hypothetical protein
MTRLIRPKVTVGRGPVWRAANMCLPCQSRGARVCPHYHVPATCAEVGCKAWANGWQTVVPDGSDLADFVRHDRERRYVKEERTPDGMVRFTFPPGQKCYRYFQHRRRLEKGATFTRVADGRIVEQEFDRWAEEWNEAAHLRATNTVKEV